MNRPTPSPGSIVWIVAKSSLVSGEIYAVKVKGIMLGGGVLAERISSPGYAAPYQPHEWFEMPLKAELAFEQLRDQTIDKLKLEIERLEVLKLTKVLKG